MSPPDNTPVDDEMSNASKEEIFCWRKKTKSWKDLSSLCGSSAGALSAKTTPKRWIRVDILNSLVLDWIARSACVRRNSAFLALVCYACRTARAICFGRSAWHQKIKKNGYLFLVCETRHSLSHYQIFTWCDQKRNAFSKLCNNETCLAPFRSRFEVLG